MKLSTKYGGEITPKLLTNYLGNLVNLIFKILPIRESGETSLPSYMESLEMELIGCKSLIAALDEDPMFLSILSIIQHLIENPESSVDIYRREVFKAISLCNKLKDKYAEKTDKEG